CTRADDYSNCCRSRRDQVELLGWPDSSFPILEKQARAPLGDPNRCRFLLLALRDSSPRQFMGPDLFERFFHLARGSSRTGGTRLVVTLHLGGRWRKRTTCGPGCC